MKEITLLRNGKHVKVPIVYSIFDIGNSLLSDNFETEAKNATHALHIYFKKFNKDYKVKRGGGKFVDLCVTPQFFQDGSRYKAGRRTWYKILPL